MAPLGPLPPLPSRPRGRQRPRRRLGALALAAGLAAALLPGCASHHSGAVHATATFDDVADLTSGAPVMMADVTVGSVRSIRLDRSGRRATVQLTVDRSAKVPAAVEARVRRTSPLGEKFVDLHPLTRSPDAPLLADGTTIRRTAVVSDLEQLVSSGTDAFEALSASQIAILLDEGSRAFGGKGAELRAVLAHLSSVAHGYRSRTGKITAIVRDLDQLAAELAPATSRNGEALGHLRETLLILDQEDVDFYALVRSLDRLADDGNRILRRHMDQITNQIRGLRDVADAVADEQGSLGGVLENLPRHNENVPSAERDHFINVLLDIVLCGLPGGGDVPGDPVDECVADSGASR
ncbi:MAG: MlaD family protein [Acidimicrobiales bacterium]